MNGLYISNPTKQTWEFHYRMPSHNPTDRILNSVKIPSGGQVILGPQWDEETLQHVVKQLTVYGARHANDAKRLIGSRFTGLLYSLGVHVEVDEIEAAHEAIVEAQTDRSVAAATNAALGFDRSINKGRADRRSKTTGVEVTQQLERGKRPTGNEVNFSLEVDPDGRSDLKLPA